MTTIVEATKLAQEQLEQAAQAIEERDQIIEELQQKVAAYEHRDRARYVAQNMMNHGLIDPVDTETKVAELVEYDPEDLDIANKAAEMASGRPGASFGKIASAFDPDGSGTYQEAERQEQFYKTLGVL